MGPHRNWTATRVEKGRRNLRGHLRELTYFDGNRRSAADGGCRSVRLYDVGGKGEWASDAGGDDGMRNDQCTITITTQRGSVQSFRKGPHGWVQTSSKGNEYEMTAEQVLSHLLPALVDGHPATVRVQPDRRRRA